MYFLYSVLTAVAAVLLLPYWIVQGLRHGKYFSGLRERLGITYASIYKLPADRMDSIWLHAVSVGEVLSAVGLARRLKDQYPDRPLIVSTTTATGRKLARERIPFADPFQVMADDDLSPGCRGNFGGIVRAIIGYY